MYWLAKNSMNSIRSKQIAFGATAAAVVSTQFFFNWGINKTIYPPNNTTTDNRLFPTYVYDRNELHDVILFKEPLLLNFTYQGDKKCNKLTQSLFDILAYKENYPLDSKKNPVNLANISCDTPGARDMMLTYGINKVPSILCLHKQIPYDKYVPKDLEAGVNEKELKDWIAYVAK